MKLLTIFIILNVLNVIIQTAKSLLTVKGSKIVAAVSNAVAYGLYTIVLIYMTCDLNMWLKAFIVAICNLIGVYIVKVIEEKMKKEKLWKIEATVYKAYKENIIEDLKKENLPFNYIDGIGKYIVVNIFCETQKQSRLAKKILCTNKAKFFVSESKTL